MKTNLLLAEFLADVVMTSFYLNEPSRRTDSKLHDAEMKCLKIIKTFGPMPMQELAHYLHTTKARATQLVCALESHKLVARTQGIDQRVHLVAVTSSGKKEVELLQQKYRVLAEQIEQRLGPQRTEHLVELLAEITPLSDINSAHKSIREEELA